jgi:DNA-binding transcriptional LysR family regulator
MDSEDACSAIAGNELELAIVTLPEMADEKLVLEPIWIDALQVVMATDHALAVKEIISPQQLLEHPAIMPSTGTFTRKIINSIFAANMDQPKIVLETNYLETIKVMVAANLGWSILPQSMVDATLTGKQLPGLNIRRPLGIVTRSKRTLSLSSSAMIGILRENRAGQELAR